MEDPSIPGAGRKCVDEFACGAPQWTHLGIACNDFAVVASSISSSGVIVTANGRLESSSTFGLAGKERRTGRIEESADILSQAREDDEVAVLVTRCGFSNNNGSVFVSICVSSTLNLF